MKPNEKLGLVTCPVIRGHVSLSMQLGHNCVLRTCVLTQADILFHTHVSPHMFPTLWPLKHEIAEVRRENVLKRLQMDVVSQILLEKAIFKGP